VEESTIENQTFKNVIYSGSLGRASVFDLTIPKNWNQRLIVFIHGYMGFKDWGCWPLVQDFFVNNSYGFLKYNASHNGGTVENPIDFPDEEAFSKNTYSKELFDFEQVLEKVFKELGDQPEVYLIGHSRGGGIAALQSQHNAVVKWCSWAGISSIEKRFPIGEELENWRENLYRYVKNGRTQQNLPLHFDQYLDFEKNRDRLNIQTYCERNTKPCLIVHGTEDTSVSPNEAVSLSKWTNTNPVLIPNTQHTFGSSHPWKSPNMPATLSEICKLTLIFFNDER